MPRYLFFFYLFSDQRCPLYYSLPRIGLRYLEEADDNVAELFENLLASRYFEICVAGQLWSGLALSAIYTAHIVLPLMLLPLKRFLLFLEKRTDIRRVKRVLGEVFATSDTNQSTRLKEACSMKLRNMFEQALRMHTLYSEKRENSSAKQAMENYVLYGETTKKAGGLLFCIKELVVEGIHFSDGIVLPSRLYIFQTAQVVAGAIVFLVTFRSIPLWADQADKARSEIPQGFPQWYYDLIPTGRMIKISLYPAAIAGGIIIFLVILIYIPR